MEKERIGVIVALLLMPLLALSIFASTAFAQIILKTNADDIKIRAFYHGDKVDVSGKTDPGADVILKITSLEGKAKLREKGKVGFFWLNKNLLVFEHVPNLYLLYSTKDINSLLGKEEMDKYVIGYKALKKHINIVPVKNENEKNKWFSEFVKLKESSHLYAISPKTVTMAKTGNSEKYKIAIDWPYQAPPGHYRVIAYEVKDMKVSDIAQTDIAVEQDGIVKAISAMAKRNGALYGALSVIIALVVGFGISLVFKKI